MSRVSTSIHCCVEKLVSLTTKGSSSRSCYSLTLVNVGLQFVQLIDVLSSIVISHRCFDGCVRQFHRGDVTVARFSRSRTSADFLEAYNATSHVTSGADSAAQLAAHTLIGNVDFGLELLDEGGINRIRHFSVLKSCYYKIGYPFRPSSSCPCRGCQFETGRTNPVSHLDEKCNVQIAHTLYLLL